MTRPGTPDRVNPAPPPGERRDLSRLVPTRRAIAPVLSLAGLAVIAIVTLNLLSGRLPIGGGSNDGGNGGSGPVVSRTAAPSNVVVVPTDAPKDIPGTFLYAKGGNIWIQQDQQPRQLTGAGTDSMPSFSPDGQWIFFVRSTAVRGLWPDARGVNHWYRMQVPSVYRMKADGSGQPDKLIDGIVRRGQLTWMSWLREPVLSPDGKTLALASDAPDPTKSDVVIQLYNLATSKMTKPKLSEQAPLGHQDPAWRSDGRVLLYVRNSSDNRGAVGSPEIWLYKPADGSRARLSGPGFLSPSYSRDGKWIAATRTTQFGTDIVILDSHGKEVIRLTNDGTSWAPVWSPAGDAIAYLHSDGQIVDLRMIELSGSGPNWTPSDTHNLTEVSGLDAASRPDWFIPQSELPAIAPPSDTPSGSAGSSAPSSSRSTPASPSPSG